VASSSAHNAGRVIWYRERISISPAGQAQKKREALIRAGLPTTREWPAPPWSYLAGCGILVACRVRPRQRCASSC
jgi:hypothetical protein